MNFSKHLLRPLLWAAFGLGTWLLSLGAHGQPDFVERWYSRGIFQAVRCGLDWTLGLLPFSSFFLFWAWAVAWWVWAVRRRPRAAFLPDTVSPRAVFLKKTAYWAARFFGFAGMLLGLFFWMWGFNYARPTLAEHLGLRPEPLDSAALWQELRAETRTLDSLRVLLVGSDTNALSDRRFWPPQAEDTVRAAVEKWLAAEGYPVLGRVRAHPIWPEGTLFQFGTAGIYWPFTGQGNLEAGLHPLRQLPVMAHEMSHGYGFCDEGECNFIEYAACCEHPNAYIAYCVRLDYWNTLARECLKNNALHYGAHYRPGIPPGIRQDERAIRRQHNRFREIAPAVRYRVYDTYLKSQGVATGMESYEEVLMLVRAWRKNRE
jgi:hypothetical protein